MHTVAGMKESELYEDDGRAPGESRDSPLLLERLHRALARWNLRRLRPEHPTGRWRDEIEEDIRMRSLEGEWIEAERAALRPWTREVPRGSAAFHRWFEALVDDRSGNPGFMLDPLDERATLDQARWWMRQELAAEAGLHALVSLTRVRMPDLAGIAPAAAATETRRLVGLGQALGPGSHPDVVWESLALSNLAVAFALNRRYAWHAVGALGAVALTAPIRAERVSLALRRLGLGAGEHDFSRERDETGTWMREVLAPRVEEDADRAPLIAEGALLRLRAAARCARRYRSELGVSGGEPAMDLKDRSPVRSFSHGLARPARPCRRHTGAHRRARA